MGAGLLALPISARSGRPTSFFDCLFTATSATCVTGLIVVDTYTHWSVFGQLVILTMIQIGGLGLMTIIAMFSFLLRRKINLHERKLLMQSAGSMQIGGIVRMVKKIVAGTFLIEIVGAAVLATSFCPKMGILTGIYNAIFHSVSAFCNAGFDIMGKYGPFSSLGAFYNDPIVNLTLSALVIFGGIGFLVWGDLYNRKLKVRLYNLQTKVVLTTTAMLLIIGTVSFFVLEKDYSMAGMTVGERWLASFFHSVSTRTAGFSTFDLSKLSDGGNLLSVVLMVIGGSSGSTAGGMKITTLAVLIMGAVTSSRHYSNITIFKRRLDSDVIKQASAISTIYVLATAVFSILLCGIEDLPMKSVVFEVASAIGTVGLTTGITSMLSPISHVFLMVLMFAGRVGGLTLMLVLAENRNQVPIYRPSGKILIG